jgi:prenyl protein peptidase
VGRGAILVEDDLWLSLVSVAEDIVHILFCAGETVPKFCSLQTHHRDSSLLAINSRFWAAMTDKLSLVKTFVYSLALTGSYVGILYILEATRPTTSRARDDPQVVLQRLISISVLTVLLVFVALPCTLAFYEHIYESWYYAWQSLHMSVGFRQLIIDPLICVLLTSVLFIGPLFNFVVFEHQLNWRSIFDDIRAGLSDVYGIRNYIIGPITEELTFRACVLAVYLAHGSSKRTMIFVTPLYFGVAHLHHAYETYLLRCQSLAGNGHARNQLVISLAMATGFQFAFTTVFGWYVAYLYLSTANVWPCVAVHIFCNSLGMPEWTLDTEKKTKLYRTLLIFGAVVFFVVLKQLTWAHPLV